MKVSIVTVVWNGEECISDCIESVLNQDYDNIEYIVIDGGSSDATVSVIERYKSQIDVFVSERDEGIYDAMNKGISFATGDVIGILNSDDFYPNTSVVSDVCKSFNKNPEVGLVFGNVDFVKPSHLSKVVRTYSSYTFAPWKLRFGFMPAHPASFIKKILYDHVGLYKPEYKLAADFDLFVRLLFIYKFSFVKINQTLVRMRMGGASTSGLKSYWLSTREIVRSLKENRIYSNYLFVLLRLPIKLVKQIKK